MSSFASVLLRPWMRRSGWAARSSSRNAGTGASRSSTSAPSSGKEATTRAVVRSGETRPASGGAVSGSMTWSKVGTDVPPTVEVQGLGPRHDVGHGRGAVQIVDGPRADLRRRVNRDCRDSSVPDALKTSYARPDSYVGALSSETAFSASVPPAARLMRKIPIVATNHRARTGQRWRALKVATRTVQGGRWRGGRCHVPSVARDGARPVPSGPGHVRSGRGPRAAGR